MILLDSGKVPVDGSEIRLYQRGDEYLIKLKGAVLMNSRMHGSEEALAELGCKVVANKEDASILVGGLGMGFTLTAALKQVKPSAVVEVAELVPAVIRWNQSFIGHLAGRPLEDSRVQVFESDVAKRLNFGQQRFDTILLDVDNGPEGLTQKDNNWLYSEAGLQAAKNSLKPGGVLAVWSEGASPMFTQRLRGVGFKVEEARPRFHGKGRGGRHMVWLAARPA